MKNLLFYKFVLNRYWTWLGKTWMWQKIQFFVFFFQYRQKLNLYLISICLTLVCNVKSHFLESPVLPSNTLWSFVCFLLNSQSSKLWQIVPCYSLAVLFSLRWRTNIHGLCSSSWTQVNSCPNSDSIEAREMQG